MNTVQNIFVNFNVVQVPADFSVFYFYKPSGTVRIRIFPCGYGWPVLMRIRNSDALPIHSCDQYYV